MPDTSEPGTEVAVTQPLSAELVQQFAQMAMLIPSETTDAMESIVSAILNAPTWRELDDPWQSRGAEKVEGKRLRIDDITRRPSDYRDGLSIFLVVHCTDVTNGEKVVWTTSSTGIVAQLVRAYAAGWLPVLAQVVIAKRATESGYRPHHLQFFGPA